VITKVFPLGRQVAVDEPDEDTRRGSFAINTRDRPLKDDVDPDALAERTDGSVGADVEAVYREAAQIAVREYVHAVATAGEDREPPADPGNIEVSMAHSTRPSYPSTRTRAWRRRGMASVPDFVES
jgi:transitional endoplasmic reticulum ATPase